MKLIRLFSLCLLAAIGVSAADVDGTWISETPTRDGNTATVTMTLKADHNKLAGTISGPDGDADISGGEIEGSHIAFTVPRILNGAESDQRYQGTVEGNTIHFTVTFGNANFQARRKFDVTRAPSGSHVCRPFRSMSYAARLLRTLAIALLT